MGTVTGEVRASVEKRICPDDHKHGANSTCRSLHHCQCDACREFGREYEYWRAAQIRRGRPLLIDATGTRRRVRALQRLGYAQSAIAKACERSDPWVANLVRVDKVRPETAARVQAVYDRLAMTTPPTRTRNERASVMRARRYAERMDWAPPLALDDDRIDDPTYQPNPTDWRAA